MINSLKKIVKPHYKTLNRIEILADNIIHNINYLYTLQEQAELFPVLKSNAYGHGLKEMAQILNKTRVKMLAVDSFPEAQIIYKNFKGKVLILNEMPLKAYRYCRPKRTEFVVYNAKTLKFLAKKFASRAKIHLFLNTGMNREGIDDLESFIEENFKYLSRVNVSGFCSHLAESNNPDSDFNAYQEENFWNGLEILNKYKIYPKWIHLGNSATLFSFKNPRLNAFRPGLAIYGYESLGESLERDNLKPALRLFSQVSAIHNIKEGDKVSYNNSFIASQDSKIALIPFGYTEGLDTRFSNCAKFLFSNEKEVFWAEIAGKVAMNLSCLNCGNREVQVGDEVNLISELKDLDNSVENLSKKIGISPYELLVKLNANIKRVII